MKLIEPDPLLSHLIQWGRWGRAIDYQDTPPVHPCSLFLDVLSRKVLVVNSPTPASALPLYIHLKPMV